MWVSRGSFVWNWPTASRAPFDVRGILGLPVASLDDLPLSLSYPYVLPLFECSLKFTLGSLPASLECAPLFLDPLLFPMRPSNQSALTDLLFFAMYLLPQVFSLNCRSLMLSIILVKASSNDNPLYQSMGSLVVASVFL